jgi:hypothetical protein
VSNLITEPALAETVEAVYAFPSFTESGGRAMQFFHELGSLIEQRWRDMNYNEESFPDIAAQALADTSPNEHVNPWEIVRWVHTANQLPAQQDIDAGFGNPPITLFTAPRFFIDVYFWIDSTTTIHQHSFAGAFQVLLGSSIHSHYSFEHERQINAHFSTGEVVLNSVRLLEKGDIQRIYPGRRYIHSLFHLDRPSATLTVRTYHSPSGHPQYNYIKPHLAENPFYKEPMAIRKLQTVALLLSIDHPQADTMIGDLILNSDFHTTFLILQAAFRHLTSDELERVFHISSGRERLHQLLEKARRRHGHLVELIPPVFDEMQRQSNIIQRRTYLTGSEQRFFLALLLNVPDRAKVLELVKRRFPEKDPIDTVGEWVMELGTTKLLGSPEPNVLGIDYFDEDALFIFRGLLAGSSMEQVKEAIKEAYPASAAESLLEDADEIHRSFQSSILLNSILSKSLAAATGG